MFHLDIVSFVMLDLLRKSKQICTHTRDIYYICGKSHFSVATFMQINETKLTKNEKESYRCTDL